MRCFKRQNSRSYCDFFGFLIKTNKLSNLRKYKYIKQPELKSTFFYGAEIRLVSSDLYLI